VSQAVFHRNLWALCGRHGKVPSMNWEGELFAYLDDLEAQAVAQFDAERAAEVADRGRAEYAEVTLAARLMASVGTELMIEVEGLGALSGRLARVARGWLLLAGPSQDWIVPEAALQSVSGAVERAVPPVAWPAVATLGLGSALRRLEVAGAPCVIHLRDGRSHMGVVRRVGADFVEVAVGDPGRFVLIALERIAAISSRG
jgi:hypothetical protein